jgi:hypothetical protein
VFTCPRNTPRGYGHEPPTKHPRSSTKTGFNALSTFKKCQLLTYSRVSNARFIKSTIRNLLEVEKADRLGWFNVNLMPLLVAKDPEAFIGFTYTGDFIEQLCDVQLTSESAEMHWESFTGHQLRRSKEEVQQLNQIYKSRYNAQLQLQATPSQLSSLNSKAPVPITTMSELVAFIKRVWHCLTLFFPHCPIGSLAQELYKALLEQRRHLETDLEWLSKKPGEIVHYLWREADREFRHVIPHEHLLQGE